MSSRAKRGIWVLARITNNVAAVSEHPDPSQREGRQIAFVVANSLLELLPRPDGRQVQSTSSRFLGGRLFLAVDEIGTAIGMRRCLGQSLGEGTEGTADLEAFLQNDGGAVVNRR